MKMDPRPRLVPVLALLLATAGPGVAAGAAAAPSVHRQEPPAATQDVDAWIAEGRVLLDARRPDEALALFERAHAAAPSLRTELWVLRAWMDQGRGNDSLDAIDALRREGAPELELDYLYGMAFARIAQRRLAEGVTDASIQMNFEDARQRLARATEADAERFRDAWLPLAEAAWYTQELELAKDAAGRAVEVRPESARAWLQLGRIEMSRFRVAQDAEAWGAEAEARWSAAEEALSRAVGAFGRPLDSPGDRALLAAAATELGHARAWKEDRSGAADAYAVAIGWAPEAMDYGLLHRVLVLPAAPGAGPAGGPKPPPVAGREAPPAEEPPHPVSILSRCLEEGARRFAETAGPADDARDATLLWWLGWTRLELERWEGAEVAFLAAVEKAPGYVSAWAHVAAARLAREDEEGALRAFAQGWERDPAAVLAEVRRDQAAWLPRLDRLTRGAEERGELVHAALAAEAAAEATLDDGARWLVLFRLLARASDEAPEGSDERAVLEERVRDAARRALRHLGPDADAAVREELAARAGG